MHGVDHRVLDKIKVVQAGELCPSNTMHAEEKILVFFTGQISIAIAQSPVFFPTTGRKLWLSGMRIVDGVSKDLTVS